MPPPLLVPLLTPIPHTHTRARTRAVHCILQWARFRDNPQCPQCKTPFGYLWTHRLLDGTLSDFPVEESVVLLKRARWFDDYVKEKEKGKAIAGSSAAAAATTLDSPRGGGGGGRHSGSGGDWLDFYDDYDAPDEDEEVEAYYFSSRAGAARVLIGNRRWGGNGYMQAGRMYARPKQQQQQAAAGGGKGKGKQAAAANAGGSGKGKQPGGGSPALGSSPSGSGGFKVGSWGAGGSALGTPVGGGAACSNSAAAAVAACGGEGSSSGQGRRARRKARREALDAGVLVDDD